MINIFTIIGILTVALIACVALVISAVFIFAGWNRVMTRLSNHFFDKNSVRRMRVAAILSAIREFKPHKIPAVWREAKEMVEESDE